MHLTNETNDLYVSYQNKGDSVIRTVSRVGGDEPVKTTFTREEADKDIKDLTVNYGYREVTWDREVQHEQR